MKKNILKLALALFLFAISLNIAQQNNNNSYKFEMIYQVKTTPVKTQYRTGTCWDFATSSMFETELLRLGKGEFDVAEMYIARMAYLLKADEYVRFHGKNNFGEGGQAHDVLYVMKKFGVVPQSVYNGNVENPKTYNHRELVAVLKGMLDGVLKQSHPSKYWRKAVNKVLDVYLGKVPQEFYYNGKKYTPKSFLKASGFNPDNYVEITSFTHHPFYSKFVLEVPDNWLHAEYYNVPIDELVEIMDNSLKLGYSVDWDGDVGRDNFYRDKGVAIIPADENNVTFPAKEKQITQEFRQEMFDNFQTTDDHLMHITGLAKDQNGHKFYYTKNSWGTKGKVYKGYWYMSVPYVRLKTIAIMVNKKVIPQSIKEKLKIQ